MWAYKAQSIAVRIVQELTSESVGFRIKAGLLVKALLLIYILLLLPTKVLTSGLNNFVSLKYYYTWKYSQLLCLIWFLLSDLKSNGCESACWSANKLYSFQAACGWSILSKFSLSKWFRCETWNEPGTSEAERSFSPTCRI